MPFSGPISSEIMPATVASGGISVEAARDWVCAFADQTIEHAVLLLDLDLNVLWANACAGKVLGLPPAEIVGAPVHRFFTSDDRALGIPEHEALVSASFGASDDDRWMLRADGSPFWATGKTIALHDAQGHKVGAVKVFRNQTDIRMHLETLANRVLALSQAEDARNTAVATLSHELRNPLSVVGLAAAIVGRTSGNEQLAPQMKMIETNVALIARLRDDLDLASAATSERLALQIEPLLLPEVLEHALSTAVERAGHPQRSVDVLLPPGQPIRLQGDRARVHQIFVNLIGNALKFTNDNGRIWIKGDTEGTQLKVQISDDGIGISADMLESIFGIFTRAEDAASYAGGMGIGLALVRRLVELHGGTIQARSDGPGQGAEFTVRLPLNQASREQ